jgi:eukaryotic-like serine/threonine-protein kinase
MDETSDSMADFAMFESPVELPAPAKVGQKLGSYTLVSELGRGSMGVVFLAEQSEPIRRQVAIKVIGSTFRSRQAKIRFEAERQAMARLQHPNVAQIFEAGTTAEGHPYFVMENARGEPITNYCDRLNLPLPKRLELFRDVCAGVHHAHQKGVLHRDLKPSNILITEVEGRALPKIIDFGVAKALDQPLNEATLVTGDGIVGTPAFLAPEALTKDGVIEVDTRSDVYSLGVLLYELACGRRPFDDPGDSLLNILRRVVVEEANAPSVRWRALDRESQRALARCRALEPRSLEKQLRGDLDKIVLTAVAKKPEERFDSAAELAAEVERFLRHEPLAVRQPSNLYRLRKFIKRRRGVVVAGLLVLATLIAGLVARTVEARRAQAAADAAIAALAREEKARKEAEVARTESTSLSRFLINLFAVSDPGQAKGNQVTVRELLEEGARRVRVDFADQPLVRARFMQTLGDVYRKLGLFPQARPLFEEALALREANLPKDHNDIAESLNGLGALFGQTGDPASARPLFERALAIREAADPPNPLRLIGSLNNLGNAYVDLNRQSEAEALYKRAIALADRMLAENKGQAFHPEMLVALNNLASTFDAQKRYSESIPVLERFIELQRAAQGGKSPQLAVALFNLGNTRMTLFGPTDDARKLYEEALAILLEVNGPEHQDVAAARAALGFYYLEVGRLDEAEALQSQALEVRERVLLPNHPHVKSSRDALKRIAELRKVEDERRSKARSGA